MGKPLAVDIVDKANEFGITAEVAGLDSIFKFYNWAFQEGIKEANNNRNPTKMELATT